jgi:hypothetical protein
MGNRTGSIAAAVAMVIACLLLVYALRRCDRRNEYLQVSPDAPTTTYCYLPIGAR